MNLIYRVFVSSFLCFAAVSLAADDTVFARQGEVVLTQDELDAAFSRIPEIHRLAFIRDGERVDTLVQNLLRTKQVAADAKANDYDEEKLVILRTQMAVEKELAEAWVQQIVANMPPVDYAALAYEYYLAHPEEYQTPETVDVTHLLIKSDTRPEQEALETARDLLTQLRDDPAQFDEFVMKYSEDPAKNGNRGRYPRMQRGQMVLPFEEAAFAMTEPGAISDLVQTRYGFHIIRFNGRTAPETIPFEQVKPLATEQAKQRYADDFRRNYLLKLVREPIEIPDGAIETMARRYFGENLELAPDYVE